MPSPSSPTDADRLAAAVALLTTAGAQLVQAGHQLAAAARDLAPAPAEGSADYAGPLTPADAEFLRELGADAPVVTWCAHCWGQGWLRYAGRRTTCARCDGTGRGVRVP